MLFFVCTQVMFGVTFAFLLGGVVYDAYGIDGIAIFGIIMSVCELLSLVVYLLLDILHADAPSSDEKSPNVDNDNASSHSASSTDYECKESSDSDIESPADDIQFSEHEVKQALDSFSTSAIGANYINYILLITFGVESITIGYNLAISPVFILEEFDKSTTIIGITLAAGAATGTFFSVFVTLSKKGESFLKSYFTSPNDLFAALAGISISVLIAAIPFFPVYIVGLLFLMAFNDMGAVILNEIQGTITTSKSYSSIGPMGQCVRRSFNVVTAITGPLLFGILPRLPYIVAGSVTGLWLVILVVLITRRTEKSKAKLELDRTLSNNFRDQFSKMSFSQREIIKRQHKKGILVGRDNDNGAGAEMETCNE